MSKDAGINWMYEGAKGNVHREDYLLGKKIDKNFEKYSDVVNTQKAEAIDSIVSTRTVFNSGQSTGLKTSSLQKDIIKSEDPFVAVRVREETKRRELMDNPLMKARLQNMLKTMMTSKNEKKKEKKSKKDKKKKHKRSRSSSSSSSEDESSKRERKRSASPKKKRRMSERSEESRNVRRRDSSDDRRKDRERRRSRSRSVERSRNKRRDSRSPIRKRSRSAERHRPSVNRRRSRSRSAQKSPQRRNRSRSQEDRRRSPKRSRNEDRRKSRSRSRSADKPSSSNAKSSREFDSHVPRHLQNSKSQSSSDSESDHERHHKSRDDEREDPKKKSYGLVEMRKRTSEEREAAERGPSKEYKLIKIPTGRGDNKSKQREPRKTLTDEEKAARLAEMQANVKWRDEVRETNVAKGRVEDEEEKEEADRNGYAPSFIRNQMRDACNDMTVEKRLQSNKRGVQRSHGYMDRSFARK